MKSDVPQPKRYDVVSKDLVENHPSDWMAFASLRSTAKIGVIDSDVSTCRLGPTRFFMSPKHSGWQNYLKESRP